MTTPSVPELRSLELLATVARTGSITLAAQELGVTQQAASRRLSRFEAQIGRDLVVRSGRRSELTADGAALLTIAQPVLDAAAQMQVALGTLFTDDAGLTVAASLTVAEYVLPRWIMAYGRAGHDVRGVQVQPTNTAEVIRRVSDGRVDLGFVEGSRRPAGLQYRALDLDTLAVYVSPEHPWAQSRRVTAWTLAQTPLVTREPGSGCRDALLDALVARGVDRSECAAPALELPSNIAVLEAAAANVAPAVISTRVGGAAQSAGRLVRVRITGVEIVRDLGAVWRDGDLPQNRAARQLLAAAELA